MTDADRALAALRAIPCPADRDSWWPIVGSALAEGVDQGQVLAWCEGGPNYVRRTAIETIKSLASRPDNGQRGSLFAIAREHGWREPMNGRAGALQRPQEAPKTKLDAKRPPFDFAAVWRDSEAATIDHPYIARKLGLADGLRVYHGELKLNGQALDGALLVPAYDGAGQIQSWQAISSLGNKRNAPGCSIKGASFTVGGQQVLHSRVNLAVHPLGFKWLEGSVADVSPSIAELALAANWDRVIERKAVPLAFLKHKL